MNFFRKFLNNQCGISIIELTVAGAIGLIALGGAVMVFTGQNDLLKDENDSTKVRAKGRQAIKILAKEIRMAGFGLPPGGAMTDIGTANTISFRTNKDINGRIAQTHVSGTTGLTSSLSALPVWDGTDFQSGDSIVVYQTGYFRSVDTSTSGAGSSNSIPISGTFGSDFNFALNANLITINKFNDWVITLSGDEITKTIDGANTTILIDDLVPASSGMEFAFVGIPEATTSKIGITLNLLDPNNLDASIEFKTDVTLRNLGIRG
jgi:Tfp pilus assembly protein PilW